MKKIVCVKLEQDFLKEVDSAIEAMPIAVTRSALIREAISKFLLASKLEQR